MSFLETVRQVRDHLQQAGRVSLKALKREFALDDDALEELIEELIEIQRVAVREQDALAWAAGGDSAALEPAPTRPERDPRSYTPRHLADRILQSRSALEGERKQVTVLFADVKGSMELAEQVDPEEWHGILDRFFQILTDGVHRLEGTVNQYTGDGIMALFGAPIAHEDHAQRACWAALWLRDELRRYADALRVERGFNFGVRLGLNSGEVVVGKIGSDLRMDYTARGHTVGLAARVEQLAESGRVYLTGHTAGLVEGYFSLRDLGVSSVAGAAEPVRLYELEGPGPVRTRLDLARVRGFSRFVGRADEMQTLELAFHRTTEGNGQVMGVVGEAGVGKSRLCLEFVERCRAKGIPVHEAHCPAHGTVVPFLPLLELLRDVFGISEHDTDQEARQKIAGALVLLDQAFQEMLPLVFDFLGVPDPTRPAPRIDPEARQRQLFGFVQRLIQRMSEREAEVLLVDDLHWIDPGSDAFLAQMVGAVSGTRTMLLVNFRPEYHAEWVSASHYHQLPLAPLGEGAVGELLDSLLGRDPSVGGLHDLIRERTGGNPFFIEEVVQSLIESANLQGTPGHYRLVTPVDRIEVPGTVQSVLAARIDRLAEREKQLLQTAAVIGREFQEPILEAVAGLSRAELAEALAGLKAAEFIHERALYPVAEYAFKHPLTQEVALVSQLQDRRRSTHAAVARAIEVLDADRLDERAALIASHWEAAAEPSLAARWHARAARWVGATSFSEAYSHWTCVGALLDGAEEEGESFELKVQSWIQRLVLGFRVGLPEGEASAILEEGRRVLTRRNDVESLAALVMAYATERQSCGALREYADRARESVELAEQTGNLALRAAARAELAYALHAAGQLRQAERVADDGLRLVGDDATLGLEVMGYSASAIFHMCKSNCSLARGRLEKSRHSIDRLLSLARQHGPEETLMWAHGLYVILADARGDAEGALSAARQSAAIAERINSSLALVGASMNIGLAHLVAEEWARAAEALERALSLMRERQLVRDAETGTLGWLARVYLGAGDTVRALELAREAQSVGRAQGARTALCWAGPVHARALREVGGSEKIREAEAVLAEALDLVEETGAAGALPHIRLEQAQLARLRGDEPSTQGKLREAHRLFAEMGATGHAERVARELGLRG